MSDIVTIYFANKWDVTCMLNYTLGDKLKAKKAISDDLICRRDIMRGRISFSVL